MSIPYRSVERRLLRLLHNPKTQTQLTSIHAHSLRHNLHNSNLLLAHFISICGSLSKLPYATLIFSDTQHPSILLFNSIIKAHSIHPPFTKSFHYYSLMRTRGIYPDEYTFKPLIKACSNICDLKLGCGVHGEVIRSGYLLNSGIGVGVVEFYTNCGCMEESTKVFDEMSKRDVIVWNLLIRGWCKKGDVEKGLTAFRKMSERSIVSWNSMMGGLAECGRSKEVLGMFYEMWGCGFEPDEVTVVTVLPVCTSLGEVEVGKWVHSYVESSGLLKDYVSVGNSMVDFYCKCGNLDAAREVFNKMCRKNVISWNAMISGFAFNGKGEVGVELYEEMRSKEVKPNEATFVGVLACCAHAGLVERGRELFDSMTADHQIEPRLEHYGCMVDILGRSGCAKEAYALIRNMSMKPNAALWGALLSACRIHGDIELAECSVKELINIEPWNSGNYVLLSNIYAEGGRWDEVEKVRVLMRDRSVKKAPGQSAVE